MGGAMRFPSGSGTCSRVAAKPGPIERAEQGRWYVFRLTLLSQPLREVASDEALQFQNIVAKTAG
jgi:hypothetical protein